MRILVFLLLAVLTGCAHQDLDVLRASKPELMQEVIGPYDGLSKCAKQRFDQDGQDGSDGLTLSENPNKGINRLAMLKTRRGFLSKRGQDALFEFTFVRQSGKSTLVEFRTFSSTDQSDPAWRAIAECSRHMMIEPAPSPSSTAGMS
ncbi:MAG TPA: hypothetical protein PKA61_15460 [Nitrospira sp.]|nr:hypothetical protein [Nitrospira sp.]